jgi:molybdenum cofactor cytidylyltransferase
MKTRTIDVKQATGRILCGTIFRPGGKKLLAKGHLISEEDVRMLETEGMNEVWVTELEEGEVGEDEGVMQVGSVIGCGSLEIRLGIAGRANLFATEPCCLLVDDGLLKQINSASCLVIATSRNFSYAKIGMRVASVKSAPFAVTKPQLEAVISKIKENGPILQARPIRSPAVAVLYTDPLDGERAQSLFERVMSQRLDRLRVSADFVRCALENEGAVSRALMELLRCKPTCIFVASTTAPAGVDDVIGRAMVTAGCSIESFLAPVEPGNLLLLGYKDDIPVVAAPGCFRSVKPNVLDLILPAMLAMYRISGWEIKSLGHGGLLI